MSDCTEALAQLAASNERLALAVEKIAAALTKPPPPPKPPETNDERKARLLRELGQR